MNLQEIIDACQFKLLTIEKDFSATIPTGGYASDLLSCVMAGAKHGGVWVTLQAHLNIVAVAALLDQTAVIITENAQPDEATLQKANEEGITLLSSQETTFTVVGMLWEIGLRCS